MRPAGPLQHAGHRFMFPEGEFQNQGAGELVSLQFPQDPRPVDVALTRGEDADEVTARLSRSGLG